jgi:hypothetical protein
MPTELTYRVESRENCGGKMSHYVVATNEKGVEYICTRFTHDKASAEKWCSTLRRAWQVETDRKKATRGVRP